MLSLSSLLLATAATAGLSRAASIYTSSPDNIHSRSFSGPASGPVQRRDYYELVCTYSGCPELPDFGGLATSEVVSAGIEGRSESQYEESVSEGPYVVCRYTQNAIANFRQATGEFYDGSADLNDGFFDRSLVSKQCKETLIQEPTPVNPPPPQTSGTITTCTNVCPPLKNSAPLSQNGPDKFGEGDGRLYCGYPLITGEYLGCVYNTDDGYALDADHQGQDMCADYAPPSCTSTVPARRRREETPYSRAIQSRQWSRDKAAKQLKDAAAEHTKRG